LGSGQVAMNVGKTSVTTTLKKPPGQISFVGYGVLRSAGEFGPVTTAPAE